MLKFLFSFHSSFVYQNFQTIYAAHRSNGIFRFHFIAGKCLNCSGSRKIDLSFENNEGTIHNKSGRTALNLKNKGQLMACVKVPPNKSNFLEILPPPKKKSLSFRAISNPETYALDKEKTDWLNWWQMNNKWKFEQRIFYCKTTFTLFVSLIHEVLMANS